MAQQVKFAAFPTTSFIVVDTGFAYESCTVETNKVKFDVVWITNDGIYKPQILPNFDFDAGGWDCEMRIDAAGICALVLAAATIAMWKSMTGEDHFLEAIMSAELSNFD